MTTSNKRGGHYPLLVLQSTSQTCTPIQMMMVMMLRLLYRHRRSNFDVQLDSPRYSSFSSPSTLPHLPVVSFLLTWQPS